MQVKRQFTTQETRSIKDFELVRGAKQSTELFIKMVRFLFCVSISVWGMYEAAQSNSCIFFAVFFILFLAQFGFFEN